MSTSLVSATAHRQPRRGRRNQLGQGRVGLQAYLGLCWCSLGAMIAYLLSVCSGIPWTRGRNPSSQIGLEDSTTVLCAAVTFIFARQWEHPALVRADSARLSTAEAGGGAIQYGKHNSSIHYSECNSTVQ